MKFSLKTIFAVLTVACFLALIIQEMLKINDLNQQIVLLKSKISTYDPRLEKDLPLLRALEPDSTIDELLEQVEANFEKTARSYQPDNLNPEMVSIFHQPTLDNEEQVTFQVYVPEKLKASFEISIVDEKLTPADQQASDMPFNPTHPFELDLPTGISTIRIGTALQESPPPESSSAFGQIGTLALTRICAQLNGERVHETTCVSPPGCRLLSPRWGYKYHRMDLSTRQTISYAVWLNFFGKHDPSQSTMRAKYSLRYTIKLAQ